MILDEIVAKRRLQVEALKSEFPVQYLLNKIQISNNKKISFLKALKSEELGIIAEVKKASPSKGIICSNFNPVEIAKAYEKADVAAISVLTEPNFFYGSNDYLTQIKAVVDKPLLRKEFIFEEWQIYESRAIGADAILLIASILDVKMLRKFIERAHQLQMDALVEVHDEEELEKAFGAGAEIIGVNNRNLKDFSIDLETSVRLKQKLPKGKCFVAESGIHTAEEVEKMRAIGANAILVGESIVKAEDPVRKINELRGLV